MKRFLALAFAGLIGCSGAGSSGGNAFVPARAAAPANVRHRGSASLRMTIPPRKHRRGGKQPSTISPNTQSVWIAVNAATPQVFNTTPTSPYCSYGPSGTTCSFLVSVPVGSDTFDVRTYSGINATGSALDRALQLVQVNAGTNNPISITLGPIVSNTNDSGAGSLRQALSDANPGDTVTFLVGTPATITLLSSLTLSKNVVLAGPGAGSLTLAGAGATQLLVVPGSVSATISGLTLSGGSATSTTPPGGGAIRNAGTLVLTADALKNNYAGDAISSSRAAVPLRRAPNVRLHFVAHPPGRGKRAPRPPTPIALLRPQVSSSGRGGAIYNTGTLTVSGTAFGGNNVAQGSGGAIYNAAGATLTSSGNTFSTNAGAMGGAVANAGTASFSADVFTGNTGWSGSGVPLVGGYGYGGALYATGAVTVDNCTFSSNVAGGNSQQSYGSGGAIAQYGGTLALTNSQFNNNVAGGGTNGSWGYGGAVYYDANGTFEIDTTTFAGNSAGGDAFGFGGAVWVAQPFVAQSDVFNGNTATGSGSGGYAFGGALYAGRSTSLSQSSFTGNTAAGGASGSAFGGAAEIESTSILSTVTLANNAATSGANGTSEGGAIYQEGGNSTWTGASFTGNVASASAGPYSYAAGGGAALYSHVTVSAGTFASNAASVPAPSGVGAVGGAMAVEVGPLSFSGTATANTAGTQGGAFWLDDTAAIDQTTLSTNGVTAVQAPNDGGGAIYNATNGALTLTNSTLNANTTGGSAASTGGAGMLNAGSGTVSNSTFTANSSSTAGGGVENVSTAGFDLVNVTLFQNSAASFNGGNNIKNRYSDSIMSLKNSIVAGGNGANTPAGADISNEGPFTSLDYNVVQTAAVGTQSISWQSNDKFVNPQLFALGNNGGPTQTIGDSIGSPGRKIPYATGCQAAGITTDQRGLPRGPTFCDAGAFENQTLSSKSRR